MMNNRHVYPAVQEADTLAESVRAYEDSVDSYQPVQGLEYNETRSAETGLFYLTPKKPVNELEALKARYECASVDHITSQYATEIDILERQFSSKYNSIDSELIREKYADLPSELEKRATYPTGRGIVSGALAATGLLGVAVATNSIIALMPPVSILGPGFVGGIAKSYAEDRNEAVAEDVKEIQSWKSRHVDVPPEDRTWRSYDFTQNSYKASKELKTGVLDTYREASPDVERTMPSRPAVKNRG